MTTAIPSLLLIDDEEFFRERLGRAFASRGIDTLEAGSVDEALEILAEGCVDLTVVDLKMPGRTGLDFIQPALTLCPELAIIVLTGYGSIATAIQAVKLGAVSYLSKPTDADEILAAFSKTGNAAGELPLDIKPPSLARLEWEHINRVLGDCEGNISAAAKKLGLHRRSLQRKLAKFPPKK